MYADDTAHPARGPVVPCDGHHRFREVPGVGAVAAELLGLQESDHSCRAEQFDRPVAQLAQFLVLFGERGQFGPEILDTVDHLMRHAAHLLLSDTSQVPHTRGGMVTVSFPASTTR